MEKPLYRMLSLSALFLFLIIITYVVNSTFNKNKVFTRLYTTDLYASWRHIGYEDYSTDYVLDDTNRKISLNIHCKGHKPVVLNTGTLTYLSATINGEDSNVHVIGINGKLTQVPLKYTDNKPEVIYEFLKKISNARLISFEKDNYQYLFHIREIPTRILGCNTPQLPTKRR